MKTANESRTSESQELQLHREAAPPALSNREMPDIGSMLQALITKGVTGESVEAVKSLVQLYEHVQDRNAEREFAVAFNALQAEMPNVQARKAVPSRDGSLRYKFAPYEEIMEQVSPMLQKHGFTVSFSMRIEQNRIVQTCTLQHITGHKRSNDFAVRVGQGPPGSSESQADGAASTYAKRFALCNALNITIETDDDARAEGDRITAEQAKSLRDRVHATGSDEVAFLKFAGAPSYEEIRSAKYAMLDSNLKRKESTR